MKHSQAGRWLLVLAVGMGFIGATARAASQPPQSPIKAAVEVRGDSNVSVLIQASAPPGAKEGTKKLPPPGSKPAAGTDAKKPAPKKGKKCPPTPTGSGKVHVIVPDDAEVLITVECRKGKKWDLNTGRFRYFDIPKLPLNQPRNVHVYAMRHLRSESGKVELWEANGDVYAMALTTRYLTIHAGQFKRRGDPQKDKVSYVFVSARPAPKEETKEPAETTAANRIVFGSAAELTAFVEYGNRDGTASSFTFAGGNGQTKDKLAIFDLKHKFTHPRSYLPKEYETEGKLVLILTWQGKKGHSDAKPPTRTVKLDEVEIEFSYEKGASEGRVCDDFAEEAQKMKVLESIEKKLTKKQDAEDTRDELSKLDEAEKIYISGYVRFDDGPAVPIEGRITIVVREEQ